MPDISNISAIPQPQTSSAQKDQASLTQDFDDFLLLLTTQLQNQDPLSPMSSTEFTNQLVSFSGVEQQIKANEALDNLQALSILNITGLGLGFIGLDVELLGTNINYDGSTPQTVGYELADSSVQTNINILNESGATVFSAIGETGLGGHRFTWDGIGNDGQTLPAGKYTLGVSAIDENGDPIPLSTTVPSRVTGIESGSNGDVTLIVGNGDKVPITDVRRAQQPGT